MESLNDVLLRWVTLSGIIVILLMIPLSRLLSKKLESVQQGLWKWWTNESMWQLRHSRESNWSNSRLGTIILTTYLKSPIWWSECIESLCLLANALFFCLEYYSIVCVYYHICFVCYHGWSFNHFNCIHIQYSVLLVDSFHS